MSRSTGKTLSRRERSDWPSRRGLFGSLALHLLLVVGVLTLRPWQSSPPTKSPGIFVAELVILGDSDERGGRIAVADALADQPEPAIGYSMGEDVEMPPADEPIESAMSDVSDFAVRANARPLTTDETTEPPSLDAADRATAVPATMPSESASLNSTGLVPLAPAALQRDDLLVAAGPVPLPDFARFREPDVAVLDDSERQILDEKFSEWAADPAAISGEQLVFAHDGRVYNASFTHVPAGDSMGIDHVLVSVNTEREGRRWSTQMRMQRLAFSSFAQFVDRWDPSVLIHDDEIDGRFHSNSDIFVSSTYGAQPAFRGKVTTARRINTSNSERSVRRAEVFLGGLETRVQRIELPQQFVALDEIDAIPTESTHRFSTDTEITFFADGSYSWSDFEGKSPARRARLSEEPHYLLGGEGVSLRVSGTVNGKVLAYTPEDIVIVGNVLYADHPRDDPESDDFVGLIADRNVVIAEPRLAGSGDLTVHAAVIAKRRFLVRSYRSRGGNTLHVFGSLAVGSLSATEPRFRTRLEFDPRFRDARPPGFPVTDRYEVIEWDGVWTEEMPGEQG
ncbi:MAG TPA: hypothetical protein VIV14_08330 [Gammaproteobacteria bacterium]